MSSVLEKFWGEKIKEERREAKQEGRKEGREEGREEGRKEGRKEGREEERVKTIGLLLVTHTPYELLHAPQFHPLGYTQADIDAALALQQ